jgi:hypothetical protein
VELIAVAKTDNNMNHPFFDYTFDHIVGDSLPGALQRNGSSPAQQSAPNEPRSSLLPETSSLSTIMHQPYLLPWL